MSGNSAVKARHMPRDPGIGRTPYGPLDDATARDPAVPAGPPPTGLRVLEVRPLVSPAFLMHEIPVSPRAAAVVSKTRSSIADVLAGRDDRLVVIVGPCSIHDVGASFEYGARLKELAGRYADHLILVMRSYFEKARTSVGWKGFISDPDLDYTCEVNKALRMARRFLLELNEIGVPAGAELLDMQVTPHLIDLVSWASIGARTVESPIHRQLASGLPMPVGFKNRRDGSIEAAIDAVQTARAPHWFPSVTEDGTSALIRTAGNDTAHIVLRGGVRSGPNYAREHVAQACTQLASRALPQTLMIDCSHDNSRKDHLRQLAVASSISEQVASGASHVCGAMVESHLVEGRQDLVAGRDAVYGQSITDSCLSVEQTEPVLELLARAQQIRHRRNCYRDRRAHAAPDPITSVSADTDDIRRGSSLIDSEKERPMNDLVQRLSTGEHSIDAALGPERTPAALKECLERGYVHVRFTGTRGGTELGVPVDRDRSLLAADFDGGTGQVTIVGDLTLDFVRVRCIAKLDVATLSGTGRLEIVEEPIATGV